MSFHTMLFISLQFEEIFNGGSAKHLIGSPILYKGISINLALKIFYKDPFSVTLLFDVLIT